MERARLRNLFVEHGSPQGAPPDVPARGHQAENSRVVHKPPLRFWPKTKGVSWSLDSFSASLIAWTFCNVF